MAIILTESNALFLHIPKTGGQFVEAALRKLGIAHRWANAPGADKRHADWAYVRDENPDFAFAFVRDPWSRLVSAYLGKSLEEGGLFSGTTFRQFVAAIAGGARNKHWLPMCEFLGKVEWNHVWRVSEMHTWLAHLGQRFGYEGPVPEYNATRYAMTAVITQCVADWPPERLRLLEEKPCVADFYDRQLSDQVRALYAEDLRRFGFQWVEAVA